ncbi:hypothetical protein L195_g055266 [Trifolium pratense]|uniref:Transmembrane protein n=1 Tax=Trifolium pratense TaxID=57577 RepID=A0A2K3KKI7_TRIPR|nr:hypothetical protein L195_g055266 [Trifolium pratense]
MEQRLSGDDVGADSVAAAGFAAVFCLWWQIFFLPSFPFLLFCLMVSDFDGMSYNIGYGVSLKMVEVVLVLFGLTSMNCSGGGISGGCVVMKGDDDEVVLKLEDCFLDNYKL